MHLLDHETSATAPQAGGQPTQDILKAAVMQPPRLKPMIQTAITYGIGSYNTRQYQRAYGGR